MAGYILFATHHVLFATLCMLHSTFCLLQEMKFSSFFLSSFFSSFFFFFSFAVVFGGACSELDHYKTISREETSITDQC